MEITKEELNQYYIVENHTVKETLVYFNLTNHAFYKLLHLYNIEKPTTKNIMRKISRDELFKKYITENLSFSDCCKYFNVTIDILRAVLSEYKITKNQYNQITDINLEDFKKYYKEHSQEETKKYFNIAQNTLTKLIKETNERHQALSLREKVLFADILKQVSYETLYDLYIVKNLRVNECAKNLNISVTCMNNLIRIYGMNKSNDKIRVLANQTKAKNNVTLGNPKIFETYTDEFKAMFYDEEKSRIFLDKCKKYNAATLAKRFNCSSQTIFTWVKRLNLRDYIINTKSHYEQDIVDYINSITTTEIKRNKRILEGREIDIYLPEFKLGIEFNGTYWHSDAVVGRTYHINKSKIAEKNNIRLIHIWEYEWNDPTMQDKIKLLLKIALGKVETKIYARNCEIKQITNKEAKALNDKIHLQGHRNAQVTYGLFYKGELMQLMSFSKTKYNKNLKDDNSWEIIRGCPASNNIIVGGVSKLFKHFIRDYNPSSIFSYCDFNKFTGNSYEKLGMHFIGYSGPDKKYVIDNIVYNRNPSKYKELNAKKDYILWGAGSKKYLWINSD